MALPPHPNPVLAVTLPIVLSQPPGSHAPTEALRLALLGVGAVHQAYLMLRARVQGNLTGPSWNNSFNFPASASEIDFEFNGALDVDDLNVLSGQSSRSPALGASTMNAMEVILADGGAEDARGLLAFSAMMRLQATRYLALACQNSDEIRSDAALGATMAVVLIDIFSGGHQWMKNIGLAKALITSRGGPNAILNTNRPTQMKFGGGVTVSAARFWLEMLAVYETFGSLTSGEEPTLLAPGNTDWWTKDPSAGYHANSIENVFGMARSMVTLIAKVSSFLCRGIRERAVITEIGPNEEEAAVLQFGNADLSNDATMDFDFDKWLNDIGAANTPGAAAFLSPAPAPTNQEVSAVPTLPALEDVLMAAPTTGTLATNEIANPSVAFGIPIGPVPTAGAFGFAVGAGGPSTSSGLGFVAQDPRVAALKAFFTDAKALYTEVGEWQDVVPLENRDARVLAGNKTHQLAMQIVILRDIFHVDRVDPRVQEFAALILELCVECAEQSMGIDLTWPVIISGSQVQAPYHRQQVIMAFDYFRKQCCFEIESSQRIVAEVWRRIDAGETRDDWRSVVEDLGLRILVL